MAGKYLVLAGYGWSGSGAVVDLLKEFSNVVAPDVEFRLIKDPYGLDQLRSILFEKWDYINASIAIKDYLWLCESCAAKSTKWQSGLDYQHRLCEDFMEVSMSFVDSITSFRYDSYSFTSDFKLRGMPRIKKKAIRKIKKWMGGPVRRVLWDEADCFSKPSLDTFMDGVHVYIDRLFGEAVTEGKVILLDQAVSPVHPESLDLLGDAKMIVVDRDPLDIYVDLIESGGLIGADLAETRDAAKYVEWHNSIRSDFKEHDDVLLLQFEDFVENFSRVKEEILDFISWDLGNHTPYTYFFPLESQKNIGRFRTLCSKEEIEIIREGTKGAF